MSRFSTIARVSFCLLFVAAISQAQLPVRFLGVGNTPDDLFGRAVGGAGDVNNDGLADYVIGLPGDDTNGSNAGSASVRSGADGTVLYTFFGASAGDQFGRAVGDAGDVNADGFDDIIVGSFLNDDAALDAGSVTVFSGADGSVLYKIDGTAALDNFGIAVCGVGDINNDSFDDFAVGAWQADAPALDSGAARVYSGFDGQPLLTFIGDGSGDLLGSSIAGAGDVNNDGTPDIIVGALLDDDGATNAGSARVYSGADGSTLFTFFGAGVLDLFGISVDGAGDLNNDGFGDVIVGAAMADSNGTNSGQATVFSGADGSVLHTINGGVADELGAAVAGLGDINGDGTADFGCGAPGASVNAAGAGAARFYNGSDASLIRNFDGFAAGDGFGTTLSGMGDANDDGLNEILVGAPFQDFNGLNSGAVSVMSIGGAMQYSGSPNPFFTLNLEWIKNSNPALATQGIVRCSGAVPGGVGTFGVSLAPADTLIFGGFPLLLAVDGTNLQASDNFGFDLVGEVSAPVSIQSTFTAGVVFYLQFFMSAPVPAASNGLQLLVVM